MTPEEKEELIECIKQGNRRAMKPFAIIGIGFGILSMILWIVLKVIECGG